MSEPTHTPSKSNAAAHQQQAKRMSELSTLERVAKAQELGREQRKLRSGAAA